MSDTDAVAVQTEAKPEVKSDRGLGKPIFGTRLTKYEPGIVFDDKHPHPASK